MKYYLRFFPIILLFFFINACKKDTIVNDMLSIRSKATYGGSPLVFFQPLDYPQGFKIKFQTVDIMIKGFNLSDANHIIHSSDSVFVLHFTNNDLATANSGINERFSVNDGNYNNLNFGIGVDSLINIKKPSDFPSSSVLSDSYYYWDAWSSYIFMKIEGSYDADGDGNYEGTFTYHTGKTGLNKVYNLPVNIVAKKAQINEIVLNFDIKNILAADGDYIDLIKNPTSHKPADLPILLKIFKHLDTAVSVN